MVKLLLKYFTDDNTSTKNIFCISSNKQHLRQFKLFVTQITCTLRPTNTSIDMHNSPTIEKKTTHLLVVILASQV